MRNIDWEEVASWFFGILLFLFLLFALAGIAIKIYGGTFGEEVVCEHLQEVSPDNNYYWSLWSGCLVETPNGYWVDYDSPYIFEGDLHITED